MSRICRLVSVALFFAFSVNLHAGVLSWSAAGANRANRYTLQVSGGDLQLTDDATGKLLALAPLASTTGVDILGTDGEVNDTLTVDFGGSMFALRDGIRYDGGRGGFDALITTNGSAMRSGHEIINADSGVLSFDDLSIRYSNLEPLTDSVSSPLFTLSGTDAANTITLDNGAALGDGLLRVTIDAFEPTQFSNKTAVVINAGLTAADVADVININFTEVATGLTSVTINGGSGADTFNVQATAVATNINGDTENDSIVFSNGATLSGGTIDGGAGADTVDYALYTTPISVNLGTNAPSFVASLDTGQQVPPTATPETGTATFTYNTTTKTFDVAVTVTGIDPLVVNGMHIHRAPYGVNGPIIVDLIPLAPLVPAGGGFTYNATGVALPPGNEAAFMGGLTYINIHTTAAPGGLIRGQILANGLLAASPGTATGTAGISNVENANGGTGDDSLVGDNNPNTINGNDGNDTIVGARGNDTLNGGPLNDAIAWNNGDGSDVIDGGLGQDLVQVNGTLALDDAFAIGAGAGGRISLQRTLPVAFALDIGTVETLSVVGASGNDTIAVNDLTGVAAMALNLNGDSGNDTFNVTPAVAQTVTVDGGIPTPPSVPGDVLNVNTTGTTSPTLTSTSTPTGLSGSYTFGNRSAVNFAEVEAVTPQADIVVTKVDSPDPVNAGSNITYLISVTNAGGVDASTVSLTDVIPANTTAVSWMQSSGPAAVTGGGVGNFFANWATFPAGATATITFIVHVGANVPAGTVITNTATATTTSPESDTTNNSATATTAVSASADLVISKTASPDPASAGNNLTYTITLGNNGPSDAQSVVVADTIPTGTTFVSFTAPVGWATSTPIVGGTGTVTATNPTVPGASGPFIFTLVVNVPASTPNLFPVSNTATVSSATPDPNPTTNSSTISTAVNTSADLAITKSDTPDPVAAGSNITYTITLTNNGPSDAQTLMVTDVVPAGTTFVSMTPPAGWTLTTPAVGGTGTTTATRATLAAGSGPQVFTLVVQVDPAAANGSTITNTATATSASTADPDTTNNSATATTAVSNAADLSVTKTDSPDPVVAGNNLTYTITFTNNGPQTAQTVSLTDVIPANTTFVSATVSPGWSLTTPAVGGTGTVTATNASVASGATATLTLVVQVDPATADASTITNTATATSTTADTNPGNNSATATTTVSNSADLAVSKIGTPDPVNAGSNLTYTITLTNNGPQNAQNVSLTDVIPANTTFVSATASAGWSLTTPAVGGTGTITATNAAFASAATATFTIAVQVSGTAPPGTIISNTATATSATTDVNTGNNTATDNATVRGAAGIPALSTSLLAALAAVLIGLALLKLKS